MVILAHGALGPYDELIFLSVGVAFLVMMGISWFKSRNIQPEVDKTEIEPETTPPPDSEADRFRLD